MNHKLSRINAEMNNVIKSGLYRRLHPGSVSGPYITINGKKLLNMCSNDYLGMPATGIGRMQMQASSRLISGSDESHVILEKRLARHRSSRRALAFPTGYMANLGIVAAVAGKGDTIFSDELNHASIIDACRLAGAATVIYRHNDADDLLRKIPRARGRKFIITEGVFSMDGDLANLGAITDIAQKNDIITILDDAHGDFVIGRDGRGTADHLGVSSRIDIHTSSLSKGLGSFGGYVAADSDVIKYCINKSRPFIYTSALPGALAAHALKRIEAERIPYMKRLCYNTKSILSGMRKMGYDIKSQSHIIPIIIGGERDAVAFGRYLESRGIFALPIRYPTVARDQARIRMSVTSRLARRHIQAILDAFEGAGRRFGII